MRKIKFRVWETNTRTFSYFPKEFRDLDKKDGLGDFPISSLSDFCVWIDLSQLQQFTGLKDINDKEIYEGDLVKVKFYENWADKEGYYSGPHEVWYCQNSAMFKYGNKSKGLGSPFLKDMITEKLDIEIVGNVFENPELLK